MKLSSAARLGAFPWPPRLRRALGVLASGVTAAGLSLISGAQAPATASSVKDPPALTALRQRCQSVLADTGKAAQERWLAVLDALEKRRVAVGDLAGAARVREKMVSLRGGARADGMPDAGGGSGSRPVLRLRPDQARVIGAVEHPEPGKPNLRFKRAGGALEWQLPTAATGFYDVRLTFGTAGPGNENDQPDPLRKPSAGPPLLRPPGGGPEGVVTPPGPPLPRRNDAGGGIVEFRMVNPATGSSVLHRTIRPTGGWEIYQTLSLGAVELTGPRVGVSLHALDCQPMGLMDFRGLELLPTTAAPSPGNPELTRLKEVYQRQFAEQTRTLNAKYLKSLTDLEARISLTKDTDTLAQLRQEKKRMEQGSGDSLLAPVTFRLPVNDSLVTTIRGEARLTSQKDYLIRLRPAGSCEIIWKLTKLGIPPGTYEVELECRLSPETGGAASLFSTGGGGSATPDAALAISVAPGGGEGVTTVIRPGKVTIGKGSDHLFLRVNSLAKSDGSLCDLKGLRLTSVPGSGS
ncbi:MAG: hypothetical protein EOP86_15320 [Verrucomicrobiaceae bacterium]|nr:MAG: hypothetical protein EOP86_15320 [Verrucomicrobiaceae bacterium]